MMDDAIIHSDDGPIGETAKLVIHPADDYYLSVDGFDWGGMRQRSDAVRFCTSGARCYVMTTAIAVLYHMGRGDRERALELARCLVRELEAPHVRLPDPQGGDPR